MVYVIFAVVVALICIGAFILGEAAGVKRFATNFISLAIKAFQGLEKDLPIECRDILYKHVEQFYHDVNWKEKH